MAGEVYPGQVRPRQVAAVTWALVSEKEAEPESVDRSKIRRVRPRTPLSPK